VSYIEALPSPALRRWVECLWWRGGDASGGSATILPDGATDIIFDLAPTPSPLTSAFAVGTMTAPLVIEPDARELLGVRFRPGCAARFLGIPLCELTDARVPLRDVQPSVAADVAERLSFESSLAARWQLVEDELLRRVAKIEEPDARVEAAVAVLVRSGRRASVDHVAGVANMTRQHLRRRFLDVVGTSPKTFARVIRFQRLVDAIRRGQVQSWADAALDHGYYDQAHMIGDFRELSGTTPEKFHSSNR
jgi:AraC-like DNA-binding protein